MIDGFVRQNDPTIVFKSNKSSKKLKYISKLTLLNITPHTDICLVISKHVTQCFTTPNINDATVVLSSCIELK